MSSNGGWVTVFGALGLIPEIMQQPTLLRAAANFSTEIENWSKGFSTKLEKWDKGVSTAAYTVVREASEMNLASSLSLGIEQ